MASRAATRSKMIVQKVQWNFHQAPWRRGWLETFSAAVVFSAIGFQATKFLSIGCRLAPTSPCVRRQILASIQNGSGAELPVVFGQRALDGLVLLAGAFLNAANQLLFLAFH